MSLNDKQRTSLFWSLVLAVVVAQKAPEELDVRRLRVLDEQGNVRILLGALGEEHGFLEPLDTFGLAVMSTAGSSVASLALCDAPNMPVLWLTNGKSGSSSSSVQLQAHDEGTLLHALKGRRAETAEFRVDLDPEQGWPMMLLQGPTGAIDIRQAEKEEPMRIVVRSRGAKIVAEMGHDPRLLVESAASGVAERVLTAPEERATEGQSEDR